MIRISPNLAKTWKTQIEAATSQITVLSPYITRNDTLTSLKGIDVRVFTLFQVRDFVYGASCFETLATLVNARNGNFEVYELQRLHAKVMMDEDGFVTLGSQNLTGCGASINRELSVCFSGESREKTYEMVRRQVDQWIATGKPRLITAERIAKMRGLSALTTKAM